jgi:hypothetical protein
MYLADSKEEMPNGQVNIDGSPGRVGGAHYSWDEYLRSYLGSRWNLQQSSWRADWNPTSTATQRTEQSQTEKWALCAADKLRSVDVINAGGGAYTAAGWRGVRRSYSIAQHGGGASAGSFDWPNAALHASQDWPPSANNHTGVGLYVGRGALGGGSQLPTAAPSGNYYGRAGGTAGGPNSGFAVWMRGTSDDVPNNAGTTIQNIRYQPSIPSGVVLDGATTMFVTERVHSSNRFGEAGWAEIPNASTMSFTEPGPGNSPAPQNRSANGHHVGESYTFVFVDGHAESLNRRATLGKTNTNVNKQSGMWTIVSRD